MLGLLAGFGLAPLHAGFRSPESLVRNVYAYYGDRSSELSSGLPRDADTARQFFDPSLLGNWLASTARPYDFFVQSQTWKHLDFDPAQAIRQDLCRGRLRQ
jgi:hypothetical protein